MAQEFADFVIEQDFTDIKPMSGEFQVLPAGEYVADITHLEQKPSSTNNPMMVATFQVAEAEAQDNDLARACAGQKVWANYSLLQQSQGRIKTLMVACGANLSRFVASEILNSRIRITVVHTLGDQRTDESGNPLPRKVFANPQNERPLDDGSEQVAAPTPPVLKGKPANGMKPAAGQPARRA